MMRKLLKFFTSNSLLIKKAIIEYIPIFIRPYEEYFTQNFLSFTLQMLFDSTKKDKERAKLAYKSIGDIVEIIKPIHIQKYTKIILGSDNS